jgi:hypothetical protein
MLDMYAGLHLSVAVVDPGCRQMLFRGLCMGVGMAVLRGVQHFCWVERFQPSGHLRALFDAFAGQAVIHGDVDALPCRSLLLPEPSFRLSPATSAWAEYVAELSACLVATLPNLWGIATSTKYSQVRIMVV